MRKSKLSFAFATALVALSLTIANTLAEPVATVPVACMDYSVTLGEKRSFGVPLFDLPIVTGFASAVTSTSISVANVNWAPNQFAAAGAPHFVAIRTGAQAGRTLLVVGNTANTLTLDVGDTPLDTAGFAVSAGADSVELFKGDTLASLFGSTVDGAGFLSSGLMGGTSAATSDTVQVFNETGSILYYFNTNTGTWWNFGGSASQNNLILYPDEGMIIQRRGPTGKLTFSGRVPSTRLLTHFLPNGASTFTTVRFPVDTTLGGLNFGAPGTWTSGADNSTADVVAVWTGTKWENYFKNLSGQWIRSNGGNGADESSLVIPAGQALRVRVKSSTAVGAAGFFGQALPYGL